MSPINSIYAQNACTGGSTAAGIPHRQPTAGNPHTYAEPLRTGRRLPIGLGFEILAGDKSSAENPHT